MSVGEYQVDADGWCESGSFISNSDDVSFLDVRTGVVANGKSKAGEPTVWIDSPGPPDGYSEVNPITSKEKRDLRKFVLSRAQSKEKIRRKSTENVSAHLSDSHRKFVARVCPVARRGTTVPPAPSHDCLPRARGPEPEIRELVDVIYQIIEFTRQLLG